MFTLRKITKKIEIKISTKKFKNHVIKIAKKAKSERKTQKGFKKIKINLWNGPVYNSKCLFSWQTAIW
jgi:hypothetical protein